MHIAHTTTEAAAATNFDFSGIQSTVIAVVGSLIIIVLVVRVAMAWMRRSWGEIVAEIAMVLVIGWFCWFPTSAVTTLEAITKGVTGA